MRETAWMAAGTLPVLSILLRTRSYSKKIVFKCEKKNNYIYLIRTRIKVKTYHVLWRN